MFLFSDQHDWQNDPAVKQILVFPNHEAKENFYKAFNAEVKEKGIENASDNNKGAIYKLRAVKDSDGHYIPVIRCAINGLQLYEDHVHYTNYQDALKVCVKELKKQLNQSLDSFKLI